MLRAVGGLNKLIPRPFQDISFNNNERRKTLEQAIPFAFDKVLLSFPSLSATVAIETKFHSKQEEHSYIERSNAIEAIKATHQHHEKAPFWSELCSSPK